MTKRLLILLAVALPCFAQSPNQTQQVATYYVDAITPGNDANAGTAASPFATVAHVASIAATGNARVFVKLPNLSWNLLSMPYLNLKALWLGQQGASATTLYDVANGNNATITAGAWSSVQGIPGLVCNGTSTVATYTAFVGNSNFAAYVAAVDPTNGPGVTWGEGNSGTDNALIWLGAAVNVGSSQAYIFDASLNGGAIGFPAQPAPDTDKFTPHVFSILRNGTTLAYGGIPDYPSVAPHTKSMASVNVVTNVGGICAGRRTTTGSYWPGTLQAVAIYLAYPNAATQNAQYDGLQKFVSQTLNLRLNLRQYNPNDLTAGPVWVRKGGLSGLAVGDNQEPASFYDPVNAHCTLTVATNGCVRMMYTDTFGVWYAETVDPNGLTWVDSGSVKIASHVNSSIIHVGSTLYSYSRNTSTNCADLYTSPDTGAPSFTLAQACAIPLGSAGQIDSTAIYNTWVEPNASGTGYEMLYECQGLASWGTTGYNIGAATSTDLIHWTKVSTLPVNNFDQYNMSGPFFKQINGTYYVWSDGNATGSTDIYNSVSNSLGGNWQRWPNASTYPRGSVGEASQVADVMILDLTAVPGWGSTYMWYGANSGVAFTMKLATTSLTIPQIVLTTQGATTTSP